MCHKLDIQLYKITVTAKGTLNKARKGICCKGMSLIWRNGLSSEAGEQPGLDQSSSEGMTKGNPKQFWPLFRSGSSNDGPTPLLLVEREEKRKKAEAQRGASPAQSQGCWQCQGAGHPQGHARPVLGWFINSHTIRAIYCICFFHPFLCCLSVLPQERSGCCIQNSNSFIEPPPYFILCLLDPSET